MPPNPRLAGQKAGNRLTARSIPRYVAWNVPGGSLLTSPIRVGVIGCGVIAQVMHLPHLSQSEVFELTAVCDIAAPVADGCAARFGAGEVFTDWRDMLESELDAVMVLTSGTPRADRDRGGRGRGRLHVFVEKPMALSPADCQAMIDAAEKAGVCLMVGTMKRYDPAYERLAELMPEIRDDLRLTRVTTLESPFEPYVTHYPLFPPSPAPADVIAELQAADEATVDSVLGEDVDEVTRFGYRQLLLDNLIHEFNALRGVLGEPTEVVYANIERGDRVGESDVRRDPGPSLMGRPALRHHEVQAGVRLLLAPAAVDSGAALALPAQRTEPPLRRGR